LGSILIIQNSYEIDQDLLELLEKAYQVHTASDTWEGLNIIDEYHIDIFVIISNDHIEASTKDFLKELWKKRSKHTPVVFISEKPSENLQFSLYKNSSWYFAEYPINHEAFISIINHAMELVNILDDQSIMLKKNRYLYPYKVKNISRIERTRNRYIKIYSRNPITLVEEQKEFFYPDPLHEFSKRHGVEKQIKQAQQSWLVNVSDIKEIRTTDMELVLVGGAVVPTSSKFIDNFRNKTKKDE